MLHRIGMRVLPALTLGVTEAGFRKRKRILMLFPGLLAYPLYRGLYFLDWHDNILTLLGASGLFSTLVAIVAYRYGRELRWADLVRDEGIGALMWIGVRYGFLYAVQLSLMVLAILKLVFYGYTEHPAGSAMMALIIASTSVGRDAFELGHLRLLRQKGWLSIAWPDPKRFWGFLAADPAQWAVPVAVAATTAGFVYGVTALAVPQAQTDLAHLLIIGLVAGIASTLAYVKGIGPAGSIRNRLSGYSWTELTRFFLWPGVVFGWTYGLILLGMTSYLLHEPDPALPWRVFVAASTAGLISLYCYYLGWRRSQEEQLHSAVSPAMLRCPFILGILSSKKA
jgi:hypothetical protein